MNCDLTFVRECMNYYSGLNLCSHGTCQTNPINRQFHLKFDGLGNHIVGSKSLAWPKQSLPAHVIPACLPTRR